MRINSKNSAESDHYVIFNSVLDKSVLKKEVIVDNVLVNDEIVQNVMVKTVKEGVCNLNNDNKDLAKPEKVGAYDSNSLSRLLVFIEAIDKIFKESDHITIPPLSSFKFLNNFRPIKPYKSKYLSRRHSWS